MKKLNIAIILDKSSSMSSIRDATVKAFNKQVETLHKEKQENVETNVSLCQFSTYVDKPILFNVSLENLKKLKKEHYVPNGTTALNDAIALNVLRLLNIQGENDENLIIVITDGQENNSKFLKSGIKSFIRLYSSTEKWKFVFLAANNSEEGIKDRYGVSDVQIFDATEEGVNIASENLSRSMTGYLASYSKGEKKESFWEEK